MTAKPSRRVQTRKRAPATLPRSAHHYVWYNCACAEADGLQTAQRWCVDRAAVQRIKQSSLEDCAALVGHEARAIASWEETLDFYAPYLYHFVHLAFPRKKFKTRGAARTFLAEALRSDDPSGALAPYLKESFLRTYSISKDEDTLETDVETDDDEGHEAFDYFTSFYEIQGSPL